MHTGKATQWEEFLKMFLHRYCTPNLTWPSLLFSSLPIYTLNIMPRFPPPLHWTSFYFTLLMATFFPDKNCDYNEMFCRWQNGGEIAWSLRQPRLKAFLKYFSNLGETDTDKNIFVSNTADYLSSTVGLNLILSHFSQGQSDISCTSLLPSIFSRHLVRKTENWPNRSEHKNLLIFLLLGHWKTTC